MITRIEMEALEAQVHYLPQIAASLERIASALEARGLGPLTINPLAEPPEDKDEEP